MSSSSKDRGNNGKDDCQIHVDKEGESCVIKIESVGQEKMLKELLNRFNSLKNEINQLLTNQEKPKDIQDILTKFKPLEDQLQKLNKHIGDDQIQLNKIHTDLNKKFDEIKQDLNNCKDQQKNFNSSKDTMEKILQKLDNLDKILKNSHDEGQKRLSNDFQNLKQQISSKNDIKPILDAIQTLQISFDKEKTKPDILARKLDSIDQKLKESQPENLSLIKDIQTKIDPLHKSSSQTSETLTKINDRIKAIHSDTTKPHPDIIQKLDHINHYLKDQQNSLIEPIKQILNDKLNPLIQQQNKKDHEEEEKLGSPNITKRDNDSHSPNRVPLCINGMIPVLSKLSDPHVLQALVGDITKKLNDIQTKLSSSDELKRKQDELLGNLTKQHDDIKRLTPIIDQLKQQQQKDFDNFNRNIDKSFQPITQKLNDLTKQQQPFIDIIHELPKKLNDIHQSQSDIIKEFSTKIDPITKSIKNNVDHQTKDHDKQMLTDIDKKLNQILTNPQKQSEDIEKAIQPFSQIIKTLKDSIDQSHIQQQIETKKLDNLEQRLSKSIDIAPKTTDIVNPIMNKLNEITTNPTIKKLSDDIDTIKTFINKQPTSHDIITKIDEQKAPLETLVKHIHSSFQPLQQASKDSLDTKKKNDDMTNKIDKLIDEIHQNKSNDQSQKLSPELLNTLKKLDEQLNQFNSNLPNMNHIPKQIDSLKNTLDKINNNDPSHAIKDINNRLNNLDETIKGLPDQISSKSKRSTHDNDDKTNINNLRQVPLSQSISQNLNNLMATSDGQIANLFTNLLTLQTTMQNSDQNPNQDIQQYLKRIEQSALVQKDPDLQTLVQRIKELCLNNNYNRNNLQNIDSNKNFPNRTNSSRNDINNNPIQQQHAHINNSENNLNQKYGNKFTLPSGYLTKSRYIPLISEQIIRDNWPKLSQRSTSTIEAIANQPFEFDNGTNLDRLIKQNGLEHYASLTRNAIEKTDKDYDKISYMMDSIVFDKMTMIGSREALIRPWDPSLLNRASSKGFYPYPSDNGQKVERFKVNKDITLWMVETDDIKPYEPTEFLPNIERLNQKYDKIQQPQYKEICQKKREDEIRWNERYAFTKDNRKILFVNDLRSYFMDYDTKRKYQVHDNVPINPVCRTGIAGRGDLPFWGPNHCVVIILLKNLNDPEVVLMRHHNDALVLPKGFYGHETRYDDQIKIIQDPVSGQILPLNLFDYWWTNINKLNETNNSINNLKRVLNDKELKEEFAEIFSQKGCNKSVFDNGYVDHPLNTDHAWIESSIWKIQFKDWRIPEMKSAKYAIADDLKNNNKTCPFVWMKLTDAILIVPPFDRGILVDVLATGMPL